MLTIKKWPPTAMAPPPGTSRVTTARAPPPLVDRFADVLCDQWDDADDGGGDAERDRVRTIVDRESDRGATATRRRRDEGGLDANECARWARDGRCD